MQQRQTNLITLVERVTRFVIAIKNDSRHASSTALAIIKTLTPFKSYVKSITFDQGSEFACHEWIKRCLDVDIYFCEPASPYQKGSIENRNGVLRTVFPRACLIENVKQKHINSVVSDMNDRPMERLDFRSPIQLFTQYTKTEVSR